MIASSQQSIYKGINFQLAPFSGVDTRARLRFQAALLDRGIELEQAVTQEDEHHFLIIREKPFRIEITLAWPNAPLAHLAILGPHGAHDGEGFEREAEAIIQAFNDVWHDPRRQIVSCDATVRDLFESSCEHAFQELWERRLKQPPQSLDVFGRPVLGGGLRFVMPSLQDGTESCQIEVKIESFLRDTKKIFVETQFVWLQAHVGPMNPSERLKAVDDYVEQRVIPFILGEDNGHDV
ncbi:MAG: hypothetical protein QM346_11730 [Chloroflexota bacterium]|nr:hypothetical protein [Chloroflexota bacterium]